MASGTLALSGGFASGTIVSSGGLEIVSSGGTASGGTILAGGMLEFLAGGTLVYSDTVFNSGGIALIGSGAVVSGQPITGGMSAQVLAGGVISAATISAGGIEIVSNGGTGERHDGRRRRHARVVRRRGVSGGIDPSVGARSSRSASGYTSAASPSAAARRSRSRSGGFASNTTVLSGGTLLILSGGHGPARSTAAAPIISGVGRSSPAARR